MLNSTWPSTGEFQRKDNISDRSAQLAVARDKLERLKILQNDDPDLSINVFLAEVNMAMLTGNPEKVRLLNFPILTYLGPCDGSREKSEVE